MQKNRTFWKNEINYIHKSRGLCPFLILLNLKKTNWIESKFSLNRNKPTSEFCLINLHTNIKFSCTLHWKLQKHHKLSTLSGNQNSFQLALVFEVPGVEFSGSLQCQDAGNNRTIPILFLKGFISFSGPLYRTERSRQCKLLFYSWYVKFCSVVWGAMKHIIVFIWCKDTEISIRVNYIVALLGSDR
jgi:hypothetical protein